MKFGRLSISWEKAAPAAPEKSPYELGLNGTPAEIERHIRNRHRDFRFIGDISEDLLQGAKLALVRGKPEPAQTIVSLVNEYIAPLKRNGTYCKSSGLDTTDSYFERALKPSLFLLENAGSAAQTVVEKLAPEDRKWLANYILVEAARLETHSAMDGTPRVALALEIGADPSANAYSSLSSFVDVLSRKMQSPGPGDSVRGPKLQKVVRLMLNKAPDSREVVLKCLNLSEGDLENLLKAPKTAVETPAPGAKGGKPGPKKTA